MKIKYYDYNNSDKVILNNFNSEWNEITKVLSNMPLLLKGSDQQGIQGRLNFDPVATNEFIKQGLQKHSWQDKVRIPEKFKQLGTDVDFGKRNVIAEAQFSNYPFLLNNIIRAELFFKSNIELIKNYPVKLTIIITKAHMFPSANSSLYYEQAEKQILFMERNKLFTVPLRLVGLFSDSGKNIGATWTKYKDKRYSRTVIEQKSISCNIDLKTSGLGIITKN